MPKREFIYRASDDGSILFRAVGDVYFGGGIAKRLKECPEFDPLPNLAADLGKAQISYCNLECVVTDREIPSVEMSAPSDYLDALRSQFNIAGIANNHTMDAGPEAFLDMVQQLEARHFVVIGGGRNRDEADSLRIVVENGVHVGMMACADFVYAPNGKGNHAKAKRPGVSIYDPPAIIDRIREYRKRVDVLACAIHTGLEFTNYPDPHLIRDARKMIRAGANIVLVHHAHVRQGIEMYENGLIAYGLGNFIFNIDQPYMREQNAATDIGLVLDIRIDKRGLAGCNYWLSRIQDDGRTAILNDYDHPLYSEQQSFNAVLGDAAFIGHEWSRLCRKYLRDRISILYWLLRGRNFARFIRAMRDVTRRENRRWISGLFGR